MKVEEIKINQLSTEAFAWLQGKYAAVDAMNLVGYGTFLAEDCILQFGNNPLTHGKQEILTGIGHFWSLIGGLNHNVQSIVGTDHFFAMEANIDYTRKDDKVVMVHCVTIIERNEAGLATSIRIFLNDSPIFN
jgi:hypothetical protein